MENTTPILLTRQHHFAERAGEHYDLRVVIGDKAYSWATKKEMPELGKPHVVFEQPIHDAAYALSKKVVIPKGQYGAGVTYLDFARKGKATINNDEYHLDLKNGERFLIKRLNPEKYGEGAWLFARKRTFKEKKQIELQKAKKALEKAQKKGNPYLEKIASEREKSKVSHTTKALTGVTAGALASSVASRLEANATENRLIGVLAKSNAASERVRKKGLDHFGQAYRARSPKKVLFHDRKQQELASISNSIYNKRFSPAMLSASGHLANMKKLVKYSKGAAIAAGVGTAVSGANDYRLHKKAEEKAKPKASDITKGLAVISGGTLLGGLQHNRASELVQLRLNRTLSSLKTKHEILNSAADNYQRMAGLTRDWSVKEPLYDKASASGRAAWSVKMKEHGPTIRKAKMRAGQLKGIGRYMNRLGMVGVAATAASAFDDSRKK